mgnify:FL=1
MEGIVKKLNEFLSDLEMLNVKLQNYHWNVIGKGFFTTHEKLEEYYGEVREQIDEVAEHILSLGNQPLGTMKDFMENSKIREAKNEQIKSIDIMENVIHDLEELKQKAVQIKQEAEDKEYYATSALMDDYLADYSKKIWMLNAALK